MTENFHYDHRTDEWPRFPRSQLRRTEDVDYWRKRAGWFDDDAAMRDFNEGVASSNSGKSNGGGSSGGSRSGVFAAFGKEKAIVKNSLKVLSVVVALALSILMFRAIMRRLSGDSSSKKEKKRSESKTRGGSVKRTRSRSRSRKDGYDPMRDDDDTKSKRSSRSKSSRRSRSRSRPESSSSLKRSRSKSRSNKASEPSETSHKETVLV